MSSPSIRIPLTRPLADALCRLAWQEDRDPRQQAVRLLREGLIRAGALDDPSGPARTDDSAEPGPALTTREAAL